jgi:hypothetical protein
VGDPVPAFRDTRRKALDFQKKMRNVASSPLYAGTKITPWQQDSVDSPQAYLPLQVIRDLGEVESLLPALQLRKLKTGIPVVQGVKTQGQNPTSPSQSPSARDATAAAGPGGAAASPRESTSPTASGGTAAAKSRLGGRGSGVPFEGSPRSQTKKGKKRTSLATEAITRAAERAMAAVGRASSRRTRSF